LIKATEQICHRRLFLRQRFTLFGQSVEFVALLSDPIGVTLLCLSAGVTCCLFDQLSYIVSKDRDAIVDLRA
jgi:hypothetical protein